MYSRSCDSRHNSLAGVFNVQRALLLGHYVFKVCRTVTYVQMRKIEMYIITLHRHTIIPVVDPGYIERGARPVHIKHARNFLTMPTKVLNHNVMPDHIQKLKERKERVLDLCC